MFGKQMFSGRAETMKRNFSQREMFKNRLLVPPGLRPNASAFGRV